MSLLICVVLSPRVTSYKPYSECILCSFFTCNSKFNFIDAAISFSIYIFLSLYFLSATLRASRSHFCSYVFVHMCMCVCAAFVIYDCDYGLTIVILLQLQIKFHKFFWIKRERISAMVICTIRAKLENEPIFSQYKAAMFKQRLRFIPIKLFFVELVLHFKHTRRKNDGLISHYIKYQSIDERVCD